MASSSRVLASPRPSLWSRLTLPADLLLFVPADGALNRFVVPRSPASCGC